MKPAPAFAAFALLLALALYVSIGERNTAPLGSLAALAGIDPARVSGVEWTAPDGEVKLLRSGIGWTAALPIDAPADSGVARAAVNDLLAAPPDRAIPASSVHPEAFGLDRPALSITYILPDDSQAVLAIGAANPGADARYARFNDAGPVYLVRSLYVTPIENRSAESCLEHRITNIHPADVVSVTIHRGSTLTRLTRRGHHWLIASVPSPATQPSAAASTPAATQTPAQLPAGLDLPADTASVEGRAGILQRLNSIPIAHYLIHPETLPGHPQAVLEIQLRSGQTPGIEALSSVPGGVLCRRTGQEALFILTTHDVEALFPAPLTLLDRSLIPAEQGQFRSITVQAADPPMHLSGPEQKLPAALVTTLHSLAGIPAESVLAVQSDNRAYGLNHPSLILSLTCSDGRATTLRFSHPVGRDRVAATRDNLPIILGVPQGLPGSILRAARSK